MRGLAGRVLMGDLGGLYVYRMVKLMQTGPKFTQEECTTALGESEVGSDSNLRKKCWTDRLPGLVAYLALIAERNFAPYTCR